MNKKKRLLIVGSSQGVYGGIEAFMLTLCEAANKWPEYEVKLCFKIVSGYHLTEDLKKITETVTRSVSYVTRGSTGLISLIRWADVLHIQNTPPDIIFPARILGKRVLLTVHNKRFQNFTLHNLIWKLSIRLAHQRWYNSNFVWSTWEPGSRSKRSDCIPTVCKLPNNWCPPDRRKGFLFIGRWIENKGIEELIQAYSLLKPDQGIWPLTILGDGPLRPKISALIASLGIKNITTPGFVSEARKFDYLSASRWLVAPAHGKEDLGLTPIEARSIGVPSIVSDDGGLPEAAGSAALLAKPANVKDLARAMAEAIAMDSSEYNRRSELARSSLTHYLKPLVFYRSAYQEA